MPTRAHLSRLTFGASRWLLAPERRWLLFLSVALVALATFLEISEELIEDRELMAIDSRLMRGVAQYRTAALTIHSIAITALGSSTLLTMMMLVAVISLVRMRDYRAALQLPVAMLGVGLWTVLTKHWFARARPELADRLIEVHGYSFPSGHSSGTAALFVTLALVFTPHLTTIASRIWLLSGACLIALLVGFSRVYLGVHYPSDVGSGLLFGGGWALLLAAAFAWKRPLPSSADGGDLEGK